jgi:hypothetical protein
LKLITLKAHASSLSLEANNRNRLTSFYIILNEISNEWRVDIYVFYKVYRERRKRKGPGDRGTGRIYMQIRSCMES